LNFLKNIIGARFFAPILNGLEKIVTLRSGTVGKIWGVKKFGYLQLRLNPLLSGYEIAPAVLNAKSGEGIPAPEGRLGTSEGERRHRERAHQVFSCPSFA